MCSTIYWKPMPFHFMGLFIHSLCIDWGIQHILKHVSVQTAFTARFCFKLLNRTSNSNTNWHFTPVWILHPIFYNYCSFPLRIAHRMISCLCVSIKKFKPPPPILFHSQSHPVYRLFCFTLCEVKMQIYICLPGIVSINLDPYHALSATVYSNMMLTQTHQT